MKANSKKYRTATDGTLLHDGDCYIFSTPICTCGLLHDLSPMHLDEAVKLYPNFPEEYAKHWYSLDFITQHPLDIPPLMDEKQAQANLEFLKEVFGFNKKKKQE